MRIQLSDHFTYKKLLRFVISPILMMICTSLYEIVDGFFVSNYVGKTPFAAVNLIMLVCMAFGTTGIMIGTGGSAVISKTLGEGKSGEANQYFSMLVYFATGLSLLLSVTGFVFARPIAAALGAEGELLESAVLYSRILAFGLTAFVLQNVFQIAMVAILPVFFGIDGIWLAIVAAELLALVVTVGFLSCEKELVALMRKSALS